MDRSDAPDLPPERDLTLIFERDDVREALAGHCGMLHGADVVQRCQDCARLVAMVAWAIVEWKAICDLEEAASQGAADPTQALYDATTVLQAALTFTHETKDLVAPEFDEACRRLIYARAVMRRAGVIVHRDAALVPAVALPPPFDGTARPAASDGE